MPLDAQRLAKLFDSGENQTMNMLPHTDIYAQRRARVAAQLGKDAIAIIPTAPERARNRDTGYLYRHDSYFYYLTGFSEPGATLLIESDGTSTLFCQPKDLEREIWDGYRLGPEAAPGFLGLQAAHARLRKPSGRLAAKSSRPCALWRALP
jgi:Xaa-Pro aminopeptidase